MKPQLHDGWHTLEEFRQWEQQIDEREKQALRAFYDRERPGMFLTWKQLLKFFCVIVSVAAIGWILVVLVFSLGGSH